MNTETKTKPKRYDEAFKQSAVEQWLLSGKSAGQVAGTLEALQAENRRRQRELHRVAQQRAF